MNFADLGMSFDAYGIGTALLRHKLRVPENQRAYAWRAEHITQLFEDLSAAFRVQKGPYFLGTIVLTGGNEAGRMDVTDGQQRLATTSILIAAIRDYLFPKSEQGRKTATKYTSDYLMTYDEFANQDEPKFILGVDDEEFFRRDILSPPNERKVKKTSSASKSNVRLAEAQRIGKDFVQKLVATLSEHEGNRLLMEWVSFLEKRVIVIVITAAQDVDAYRMFETLNDRGLKASQIDILKNFLFSEAKRQGRNVQPRWSAMVAKIEDYDEDLLLDYVRHFWISKKGPTKAPDLAREFKKHISGAEQAVEWVIDLDETSSDYLALLQPLETTRLVNYGGDMRHAIYTVTNLLFIEQIRPLMLATLRMFNAEEAKRAFIKFISWSVRFLVVGGAGGGTLEKNYGQRAQEVSAGEITTAKELANAMNGVIPNNPAFEAAFARHSVTKSVLARYYLRCLDKFENRDNKPYLGDVERAETRDNLEHIMPENAWQTWGLPTEFVQANYKRLGNLCLLEAKKNVLAANKKFSEKTPIYSSSAFLTTQDVAKYTDWGIEQIDKRQAALAKNAPKIWTL